MKRTVWKLATILVAGLFSLMVCGSGIAAKGGIPGPPTGGETPNNLSLPAVLTGSGVTTDHKWLPQAEPVLGEDYSYGCDQPEGNEQFNYPNTSCVDNLDVPTVYYDPAGCVAADAPCAGFPEEEIYRIYWQKVDANEWWADQEGALDTTPDNPDRSVDYVDWGDALEAVSWSERSVIRVETQPYCSTIEGYLPWDYTCYDAAVAALLDPETVCKVGLQMWHVSGQGITEHWGVRATEPDPLLGEESVSFNYDSPFQIIHTSNARLNIARLEMDSATCPEPGGNANDPPPVVEVEWIDNNDGSGSWVFPDGSGGYSDACEVYDQPYTVELSVGGKYVYGYNLRMKNVDLTQIPGCGSYAKTGYYRLTFYAPEVDFSLFPGNPEDPDYPNVAPPAVPSEVRELPRTVFNTVLGPAPDPDPVLIVEGLSAEESEDPDADDRLYRPVVDTVNNLTYLDICIVAKTQGGGGGSGGGGGGGNGR
jgi:hypothetical protein